MAQIKSFQAILLEGQSISISQRESPHVVTTSTPPDTLTLLSSHPGLQSLPSYTLASKRRRRRISCEFKRKIHSKDKRYYSAPNSRPRDQTAAQMHPGIFFSHILPFRCAGRRCRHLNKWIVCTTEHVHSHHETLAAQTTNTHTQTVVVILYPTEKWFLPEESVVRTPNLVILLSFILLLCPFTNESHVTLCTCVFP